MAVYTGLRRSELAELLWSDLILDLPTPVVEVRAGIAKNGKTPPSRCIPMSWLRYGHYGMATRTKTLFSNGFPGSSGLSVI